MDRPLFEEDALLQNLFSVIPLPIFIVDNDVEIFYLNHAASLSFGLIRDKMFRKRGGDVLNCIHATETPEGCGNKEPCQDCEVRSSVNAAIHGNRVVREKARMEIIQDGKVLKVDMLITTAPLKVNGTVYSALILEDISELLKLRDLLPICSHCKKIRDDNNYWKNVESYMEAHMEVEFTHSLCPDCAKKHYPEVFD